MKNSTGTTASCGTQDSRHEAITEIAPTRIGDFYRLRLEQAFAARLEASQAKSMDTRSMLREHAWRLERDASNLAHCLAKFGDLDLRQLDIRTLHEETQSATCMGTNPWARGLALLEKVMQESSPSRDK